MEPSILETERQGLRRFRPGDEAALYAYLSDEGVVRYEPYQPLTFAQCGEFLAQMAASPDFWAVCLRGGGTPVGQVYLAEKEQAGWELGYVFNRRYQGRGLATEAARALVTHAFAAAGAHRVAASCNPDNTRSWQLLERLGFRREGRLVQNVWFHTGEDGHPSLAGHPGLRRAGRRMGGSAG